MDACNDPAVHTIVCIKSAQVGWTAMLGNVIGYYATQDPCPILMIMPTLEMAEAWSKDRLAPMVRDTPALRDVIADSRARVSENTLRRKVFPGGQLTMAGANSPAGLASRPIRVVVADEIDRYPPSAGAEGDPLSLAIKRTATYWNRKVLAGGTPTIAGASRVEALWLRSDQRRYHVPCPHCGHMQYLRWAQVRWPEGRPALAAYHCEACGAAWSEAERLGAIARGAWRPTAAGEPGVVGFHVWEAMSPWRQLGQVAADFVAAKADPERLKVWVNTSLGEVWQDQGEAPDWERLYERREDWGAALPAAAAVVTAYADVQRDRVEVSAWAWGEELQSWLCAHDVLPGDTSRAEVWDALARWAQTSAWATADGRTLRVARLGIDSGYATQEVYAFARRAPALVMACDGRDNLHVPLGAPVAVDVRRDGKRIRRGARVWPVGVSMLKTELYGWLRQAVAEDGSYPRGYVHLPAWVDPEYCKQLVAEQLVTRRDGKREWQKLRDRNEALDCRVGARAVAAALGIDRWAPAQWARARRDSADRRPREAATAPPPEAAAADLPPPAPQAIYRRLRPAGSWMGRLR